MVQTPKDDHHVGIANCGVACHCSLKDGRNLDNLGFAHKNFKGQGLVWVVHMVHTRIDMLNC